MTLKAKVKYKGVHVQVRVYVGPDEEHLAYAGEICMREDEWRKIELAMYEQVRFRFLLEVEK